MRALCGVKVSERGQLDVGDVGSNLMPWTSLQLDIRKEVAQEKNLDMGNWFGYAATQRGIERGSDREHEGDN